MFSVDRIDAEAADTQVIDITSADEQYKYVYRGLCRLAHTLDRYQLLPRQWNPMHHSLFALDNSDTTRTDVETSYRLAHSTCGLRKNPPQAFRENER